MCGALTNTLHGLSRLALGQPSITPAMIDRLYDESSGLFGHQAWPGRRRPRVVTWAGLAPLALPDLPEAIGRRLVEEHLLDPARFWLPVPPPSVAADERTFSMKDTFSGLRRYWRGPTWVNSAWLVWLGLLRLGYDAEAQELARRVLQCRRRRRSARVLRPGHAARVWAPAISPGRSLATRVRRLRPRGSRSYV